MIRTRIKTHLKSMINIDLFTQSLEVRTDQVLLCSDILYYTSPRLSSIFLKKPQKNASAPVMRAHMALISGVGVESEVLDLGEINGMGRSADVILEAVLSHKLLAVIAHLHLIIKV